MGRTSGGAVSRTYRAVGWTRDKKRYDLIVGAFVVLWLVGFVGTGLALFPDATVETLLIRALGSCAIVMLHAVISIGPLSRLDRRFLPLLYNRRHLGVATFLVALAHGLFCLVLYHAQGDLDPLTSVLVSNTRFESLVWFPFQPLGVVALGILLVMAATSHDFWLHTLTPTVWKSMHMLVYLAWVLALMHVALGVMQAETSVLYGALLVVGAAWVVGLHVSAAWREMAVDRPFVRHPDALGFVDCAGVGELADGRARIVSLGGERVAIFRNGVTVSAVSNVCRHQHGPLGEGRIVDGCITCPWHGYQYRPEDGRSPPPFTEKLPTYRVAVYDGRVWVHPEALPPGTRVEPAMLTSEVDHGP